MTLGERIKDILKKKGISQKKLANDLGIPESTITALLKSKYEPSVYKVKAIAKYLNLDLTWLITGVMYKSELQEPIDYVKDIEFIYNEKPIILDIVKMLEKLPEEKLTLVKQLIDNLK
jgi:transcriptional regulator with XRE-family HTH domain